MVRDTLVVLALVAAILLAAPEAGFGTDGAFQHEFRFCPGDFALCAASTCTPTGGMITVNTATGTAQFPEAQCTCPIFPGPGLADLSGGNMQGSCAPPTVVHGASTDEGVWSLYALMGEIPQAINDWNKHGKKAEAPVFLCAASLGVADQLANCFSFACLRAGKIHGVPVATCYCPLGESLEGTVVPANTAVGTQAGQCNEDVCSEHPVAAPIPFVQGGACFHFE